MSNPCLADVARVAWLVTVALVTVRVANEWGPEVSLRAPCPPQALPRHAISPAAPRQPRHRMIWVSWQARLIQIHSKCCFAYSPNF